SPISVIPGDYYASVSTDGYTFGWLTSPPSLSSHLTGPSGWYSNGTDVFPTTPVGSTHYDVDVVYQTVSVPANLPGIVESGSTTQQSQISGTDANGTTTENATLVVSFAASDANGATTDTSFALTAGITASDTNTVVTEVATYVSKITQTDANGYASVGAVSDNFDRADG